MSQEKTVFKTLSEINLSPNTKTLPNSSFKYVPWSDAWGKIKEIYPSAVYKTHTNDVGDPFFVSILGIFVRVTVTINEDSQTIDYPVLNGANKALKAEAYSYKVKEYVNRKPTGKYIDKPVNAATAFDINTSIMRAMVKCLALHGLGLHIFKDEDAPSLQKIDSHQLTQLTQLHTEHNISVASTNKAWNIDTLSNLEAMRFDSMVEWLTPKEA